MLEYAETQLHTQVIPPALSVPSTPHSSICSEVNQIFIQMKRLSRNMAELEFYTYHLRFCLPFSHILF